jgi:hypothetical protein
MSLMPTEAEDEFGMKQSFRLSEMKDTLLNSRLPQKALYAAAVKLAEEVDDFYAAKVARQVIFMTHLLKTVQLSQRLSNGHPNGAMLGLAAEMLMPDLIEIFIAGGTKRKDLNTLAVAAKSDEQENNEVLKAERPRIIRPGQ